MSTAGVCQIPVSRNVLIAERSEYTGKECRMSEASHALISPSLSPGRWGGQGEVQGEVGTVLITLISVLC
jgi:hypothetical protein